MVKAKSTSNKNMRFYFVVMLALVILGGLAIYKTDTNVQFASILDSDMQEDSPNEIQELLDKVSEHVMLPDSDEYPMVVTIENVDFLAAKQEFYQNAKNGDKLIIYPGKALIYSPDRNIVVNVGPVYYANQVTGEVDEEIETITEK